MTDAKWLAGRRAVVTGAASGIGRATARRLANEGAVVVAVDVDEAVHATVEGVAGASATVADVCDETAMAELFDEPVDVLVANAGVLGALEMFPHLDLAEARRVMEVNLFGTLTCMQLAARGMVSRGAGSIVCTASVAGLRSGAGPLPYSASKAAVINLVQNAAWHLSGTGVRVNGVAPGLVETGMTRFIFDGARAAGKEDRIGQLNPSRRAGTDAEIAAAVAFLASDEASYVNGQVLPVDGGLSASLPVMPGRIL